MPYSYGGVLSLLKDGNWDCHAWQISRGVDGDDPAPEMDFLALPENMMTALYDTLIATLDSPIRPDNAIVMSNDEFNKSFYIY
ncbi:hypothetical protein AB4Y44_35885 [Paraburkholderia sp. BR10937]|uniref:hypothetical protein n=1 Tax=Paraburkholderia sp. BR10937 TaxID=3236994 RepID=UPI0034D1BFF2